MTRLLLVLATLGLLWSVDGVPSCFACETILLTGPDGTPLRCIKCGTDGALTTQYFPM